MVQAIAAIGAVVAQMPGASSGASVGALQAQLQKCQNQLADWVGCPSGKTPQGQAMIQQIESQTASIKAQMARIETQKAQQAAAAQAGMSQTASPGASPAVSSASGASGAIINTFA